MPTPLFLEAGTAATFDTSFWVVQTGTVTSDASVVRTGPRSLNLGSVSAEVRKAEILANTGRRLSLSFYLSALDASTRDLLRISQVTVSNIFRLRVTAAGVLIATNNVGTQVGSDGPTLLANRWYRIALSWVITSSTVYEIRVFVDGVLGISVSNSLTMLGTSSMLQLFNVPSGGATYYSDVYVDDGATLDDPGDIRVTAKRPASHNVNTFTTAIGANPANRWENVNERPLSETNGWEDLVLSDRENFGIEPAGAGDITIAPEDTLVARCAWVWAKGSTGGLGTPALTDDGGDVGIVLTAAGALFTNLTASAVYPTNPATIGMLGAGVLDNTFLYECGVLIAFIQATTPEQKMAAIEQFTGSGGQVGRRAV